MTKHRQIIFYIFYFLMSMAMTATAAPLRPVGPVDVTGLISEIVWVPEQKIKGQPGMSGSAGHDRINPAHFLVTLLDYEGVASETAVLLIRYLNWSALKGYEPQNRPPFILLRINHSDRNALKKGQKIRVIGYRIGGDEGGTWTSFNSFEILNH
jgi:hypothetical protein